MNKWLITEQKCYEVKIGLKGLILHLERPNNIEPEDLRWNLYLCLISNYPTIGFDDIDSIIFSLPHDDSFANKLYQFILANELSLGEIKAEYSKAVGELGLSPSDAWSMSPEEIEVAYEGYLHRQEIGANLTKLAISYALTNNKKEIRLLDDPGYILGSIAERKRTFDALGISEV